VVPYPLEVTVFIRILESLTGLTGLHFSLYDDKLQPLISSAKEDSVLSLFKSVEKGQSLYNDFATRNLQAIRKRKGHALLKGPTSQYHIFNYYHFKERDFYLVAEAFYASLDDFRDFCEEAPRYLGLRKVDLAACADKILIISIEEARRKVEYIRSIIENTLILSYEKGELDIQRQWSRAIMNLLANLRVKELREIYRFIIDTVIFLFNVDTAAVFELRKAVPSHIILPQSLYKFSRSFE
jgi:hypothetical protein